MTRGERADRLLRALRRAYPDAHCELAHRNPFELLVATILSAQCTDVRVNMVTPALFKKYPDARAMAAAIEAGVVVDTHVGRLSQRLGLTKHRDPLKIEQDLMKVVPRDAWTLWSHLLIWHGRRRCFARNPDCGRCELSALCPTAGQHAPKKKTAKKAPAKRPATR